MWGKTFGGQMFALDLFTTSATFLSLSPSLSHSPLGSYLFRFQFEPRAARVINELSKNQDLTSQIFSRLMERGSKTATKLSASLRICVYLSAF